MNRSLVALLLLMLASVPGCALLSGEESPDPAAARALSEQAAALFGKLPEEAAHPDRPRSEARVRLGRMLYYEPRLSKSGETSCNSCHLLDQFGVDNEPTSPGHLGQRGDRNSPTTYNAAFHVAQFWDGRAADVEEQATGPVTNPVEMAIESPEAAARILKSIPGYAPLFAEAFPGESQPIHLDNVGIAIGAFERGLVTPGPFDRFVAGDIEALDAKQQRGLQAFLANGCTTCHMGATLGGMLYQKVGLVHPYETEDVGRMKVTGNESDKYFFKVPSLRNVAETAPYFHDGSVATLEEAVRLMAWHQLGRELDDGTISEIVAFLGSLTGEIDWGYVAKPELPPSSG